MSEHISRRFLCQYLSDYTLPEEFSNNQYHALLRVLIRSKLHGSVAMKLDNIEDYPAPFKRHLISIKRFSQAQNVQVMRACNIIAKDLTALNTNVLLLKGAAYIAANKDNAKGRLISDVDILVTKDKLNQVEELLLSNGWKVKELDDFDEKYYRQWSHELPPYTHLETGVTLDVHHNLLPGSAGKAIDINDIISSAQTTSLGLNVPSDEYLILHSAIHLLLNDDIEKGLRDCVDLHHLLQQYVAEHDLSSLQTVFTQCGCEDEYHIMLLLLARLFGKSTYTLAHNTTLGFNESPYTAIVSDLEKAVFPSSEYLIDSKNTLARYKVYLRGHLSKMPLSMLIRHLGFKGYRTVIKKLFGDAVFKHKDS